MGEMLCGMGNDTGSGVAILAIGAVVIYLILFIYGPLEMVPYLAEFVTTVLPLQGTMKGIVTSARDALRQPGEDYTEGNLIIAASLLHVLMLTYHLIRQRAPVAALLAICPNLEVSQYHFASEHLV